MAPDKSRIPVCRSEFLQDVTIELGRQLKSIRGRPVSGKIEFTLSDSEHDGGEWECFDASRWLGPDAYIQVVVLENGVANYVRRQPSGDDQDDTRYEGYVVDLKEWTPSKIAELIRDSLGNDPGVLFQWRKMDTLKRFR